MSPQRTRILVAAAALLAAALAAAYAWQRLQPSGPGEGFASGNGRIEATEIDVAAKQGGRLLEVLAKEGDFVQAGQVLARMQVDTLNAQREEVHAQHVQAQTAVATAKAQVAARESERQSALAQVAARESDLDAAQRRLARSQPLAAQGMWPQQELDNDRAKVRSAQANLNAARAQVQAAQAAIEAARSQVAGAEAAVAAVARSLRGSQGPGSKRYDNLASFFRIPVLAVLADQSRWNHERPRNRLLRAAPAWFAYSQFGVLAASSWRSAGSPDHRSCRRPA